MSVFNIRRLRGAHFACVRRRRCWDRRSHRMPLALRKLLDPDQRGDGTMLAEIVAQARAAWPMVELATEHFVEHLAARLGDADDPELALRAMHTSDLYLACACMRGDAGAVAAFEAHCLS